MPVALCTILFAFLGLFRESRVLDPKQTESKSVTAPKEERAMTEEGDEGDKPLKEKRQYMTLLDEHTIIKIMSLCWSICKVLELREDVHMERLGTHLLEHYFGLLRRMCMRDDSSVNFERVVGRCLLANLLADEHGFRVEAQPKRISDSGGVVEGDNENFMTIQEGFLFMMDILEICGHTVPSGCHEIAAMWREHVQWERKTLHDLFVLIPEENIYCQHNNAGGDEYIIR